MAVLYARMAFLLPFAFFVSMAFVANAQGEREKGVPSSVNIPVTLVPQAGHLFGTTELGTLEAGSTIDVNLDLFNPTLTSVGTDHVKGSCSCINIKKSKSEIPANGSLIVSFSAKVPASSRSATGTWRIDLRPEDSTSTGVHLRVSFRLAGLVNFYDGQAVFTVTPGEESSTFVVPMVITEPIDAQQIKIDLPEEFCDVRAKCVVGEGRSFLQLDVLNEKLPVGGLAGEIRCIDPASGREDEIFCIIKSSQGLSVFPAVLRVVRSSQTDGDAKELVANAILRIDRPKESQGDENERGTIVEVRTSESPLTVTHKQVSSNIIRASIRLTSEVIEQLEMKEPQKRKVYWTVRTGRGVFRCASSLDLVK